MNTIEEDLKLQSLDSDNCCSVSTNGCSVVLRDDDLEETGLVQRETQAMAIPKTRMMKKAVEVQKSCAC